MTPHGTPLAKALRFLPSQLLKALLFAAHTAGRALPYLLMIAIPFVPYHRPSGRITFPTLTGELP